MKKRRYQISIGDPKICALLDMYPREKGHIVEQALEQFLKTDNEYTRRLRKLTEEAEENLRLLKSLTGDQVEVLEDVRGKPFGKDDPEDDVEDGFSPDDLMLM